MDNTEEIRCIFWKIEALKTDIRGGTLTEKQKFIYAFIYLFSCEALINVAGFTPLEGLNMWDGVYSVSSLIIMTVGTLLAFKANGGVFGTDFLGKYFSISFVVAIRFAVILIPIMAGVFSYSYYAFPEDNEFPSTFWNTTPGIIWYAALYWRVVVHIKDVKELQSALPANLSSENG